MRKVGFIFLALLMFAGLASAQVPTSGNVFFGYSYENTSSSTLGFANSTRANLNGWEASVEGKVFPLLGFVADVAGHYGTQNYEFNVGGINTPVSVNGHEITAMFGPRISAGVGKFRPSRRLYLASGISPPPKAPLWQPILTSRTILLSRGRWVAAWTTKSFARSRGAFRVTT